MEFGIEPGQSHYRIADAVSRQLSAHRLTRQEFLNSSVQQGREGGEEARNLRVLISAGARPLATPTPALLACTQREVNALSGL